MGIHDIRDRAQVMDQAYNSSGDSGPLHPAVGGAVPAANFPRTETAPGNVTPLHDYSPFGLTVSQSGSAAASNVYRYANSFCMHGCCITAFAAGSAGALAALATDLAFC